MKPPIPMRINPAPSTYRSRGGTARGSVSAGTSDRTVGSRGGDAIRCPGSAAAFAAVVVNDAGVGLGGTADRNGETGAGLRGASGVFDDACTTLENVVGAP